MTENRIISYITPPRGCVSVVQMKDGPCRISITKKSIIIKKSRWGLLGDVIFQEIFNEKAENGFAYLRPNVSNLFINLENQVHDFLSEMSPELGVSYSPLKIVTNAALSCDISEEFRQLLEKNT